MYKYVFFDFNGTLINDLDLCLDLLNEFLIGQNKPVLNEEQYKEVFTFPIRDYYIAAGIDFSIESYESLSIKFIEKYQPASMHCGLFDCVEETIKRLHDEGIHTYILSASEKNNLLEQCTNYDIVKYFDDILGIDNIHAGSKVDIAVDYINKHNIPRHEVVFIGDSLHDFETAQAMGVDCRLVSCGHQSVGRLKTSGVEVFDNIKEATLDI